MGKPETVLGEYSRYPPSRIGAMSEPCESPILLGAGTASIEHNKNEHSSMGRRHIVGLAAGLLAAATPLFAQAPETYTARLSWVPIGGAERNDVAGDGSAAATLSGTKLTITGSFEGLPAELTAAKLHEGVATGARGRGKAIADLRVSGGASGTLSGETRLSAEQLEALKAGRLYVQVYSEKGVLPDHATLWGWLLH